MAQPMLRYPQYTRKRIAQLTDRFRGRIHRDPQPIEQILVSPRVERIPYDQAMALDYRPAKLGEQFGPLLATYWFKLRVRVPEAWADQRVDLLWITHGENTVWIDGRSVQGLNYSVGQNRPDAMLLEQARGGETLELAIEMACNDVIGNRGQPTPEHRSPFFLDVAQIAAFDPLAWEIYHDLLVLRQLEQEQVENEADLDRTWAGKLLYELNRFANTIDEQDRATWREARPILQELLSHTNGSCAHELSAIGHAHIDTAWLWPLAETHRKCVRSFSSQLAYMQRYPEYRFACSQAYQYQAIKQQHPELYQRIQDAAARGQWVPVGGTWVEPDCNLPSGESLCRQFLMGQRFFEGEFGRRCREFWNPDVFGYNGQLPQIMREAGIDRFLTQKLSWNAFNKPMHHSFHWQGIDGSQVLTHFPPADTYNADCSVTQLRRHARAYKDNDRSGNAFYLFGYGDGGGGPTPTMLEVLRRVRDLQGVPRSAMRTSEAFFDRLETEADRLPTVVGELYFELHRGTYTTQGATKRGNRKSEWLLHDVEFLAAMAHRLGDYDYPTEALTTLWQAVLLEQFHDVLPGSSVRPVYEDTEAAYRRIAQQGGDQRRDAGAALARVLTEPDETQQVPVNTIGFARREVCEGPDGELAVVDTPAYGLGEVVEPIAPVRLEELSDGTIVLENAHLAARLDRGGQLLSLRHTATGREAIDSAGNVLELYDDQATNWDAWDIDPQHLETRRPCPPAESCTISERGPLRAEVAFERPVGRHSRMTQHVRLDAEGRRLVFVCDVDWHEYRTLLKVAFPVNVSAMNATYEMPFGCVERPTHLSGLVALARYEVPGHRWSDLSEHGFGVSLLSESKYGYSTLGNVMRLSLLRSPKSPDPQADMGRHHFAYALYPHEGRWQEGGVVAEAMRFNAPVHWAPGRAVGRQSLLEVHDPNLVLDTVKKAEDDDALVLRLYEAHGSRGEATLSVGVPFERAVFCNVLEDEHEPAVVAGNRVTVPYSPWKIISLKLR